ncbi:MAG: hypothetical protein AB7N99_01640 [Simkaniaceae bacterium]|jgi:uncharacterized protein YjeT (DUF2065 family)|nr:hypothetical protein [Chlamydiia bacterium]
MHAAVALAKIFGPVLVIMGVWSLLYQDNVKKVADSVRKTPAILYLGGVVNLVLGLAIITSYNIWEVNLELLVTLLGWFLFIRALLVFFLPNAVIKMSKMQETAYVFFGLLSVVWGLAMSWLAFMMY